MAGQAVDAERRAEFMASAVDEVTTKYDFNESLNFRTSDNNDDKFTFIPYQVGGQMHSGNVSKAKLLDEEFSKSIRDDYLLIEPNLRTANMNRNKRNPNRYYPPEDINDPKSRRITPEYLREIQNSSTLTPAQKAEKMSKIRKAFSDWDTFTSSVRMFMSKTGWTSLFKQVPINSRDIKKIMATPAASEVSINEQYLRNWRNWLYTN
jgi:hypothetical protein